MGSHAANVPTNVASRAFSYDITRGQNKSRQREKRRLVESVVVVKANNKKWKIISNTFDSISIDSVVRWILTQSCL